MENPFQLITNDLKEIKSLISKLQNQQTPPKQNPEEDLTDIHGAGKILKKAIGTVYNQVSKNEIPHFKRGKKLYFSKKALIKYIQEGKILTSKELESQVNETLHNQKKRQKSKPFTRSERLEKFNSSSDIDNLTAEELHKETSRAHYYANQETLKNGQ